MKTVPLEIYTTRRVSRVQYRVDQQPWQNLKRSSHFWWKGAADISGFPDGKHNIEFKALDKDNNILSDKTRDLWVGKPDDKFAYIVNIETDKKEYFPNEKVHVSISLKDGKGNAVSREKINYSIFQSIGWEDHFSSKVTDNKGQIAIEFSPFQAGYMNIAAGINYQQENGFKQRYGALMTIYIKNNKE